MGLFASGNPIEGENGLWKTGVPNGQPRLIHGADDGHGGKVGFGNTGTRLDEYGNAYDPQHPTAGQPYSPYPNIVNPNAYEVGGRPGGAQADVDRDRGMAAAAEGRAGVQQDNTKYNADRAQELGARGNQQFGLANLRNTIEGNGPSVALQQGNIAFGNAASAGAGTAASGRGGAGNLAAAHRMGANQAVGGASASGFGAAQGRGAEISAAQGQYVNAANAQRSQDLQRSGLSLAQATQQAQLEAQQRAQNDARSMGMENMSQQTELQQMGAQQAQEAQSAGLTNSAKDRSQTMNTANKQSDAAMTDAAIGLASAGASAASSGNSGGGGSDIRVKENIEPGSTPVQRMLDKLRPYTFDYKDPAKHGEGTRTGVMAQDLEKSPMGANVVHKDNEGVRRLDPNALAHATIAAVADLHHRQKETDGRLKAVEGKRPVETSQTLNKSADEMAANDIMAYPARALPKGVEETSYKNWGLDHAQAGGR